jgi:hypothetical protein
LILMKPALYADLLQKNDVRCTEYLLKKLETNKSFNDLHLKDIIKGLMQAQYPKIVRVILEVLEHNFKRTGHYIGYYFNDFARILRLLPSESARDLEDFASGCDNETAARLFEVAHYIKNK